MRHCEVCCRHPSRDAARHAACARRRGSRYLAARHPGRQQLYGPVRVAGCCDDQRHRQHGMCESRSRCHPPTRGGSPRCTTGRCNIAANPRSERAVGNDRAQHAAADSPGQPWPESSHHRMASERFHGVCVARPFAPAFASLASPAPARTLDICRAHLLTSRDHHLARGLP